MPVPTGVLIVARGDRSLSGGDVGNEEAVPASVIVVEARYLHGP
jgi:hypothetical protein